MLRRLGVLVGSWSILLACASSPSAGPAAPEPESEPSEEAADKGGPSSWSEAEPLSVSEEPARKPSKRKGSVLVKSDPEKHGPQLNFRFAVNGLTMDGVFSMPGGRTYTFSLPAGTVTFTVDECNAGEGGFELEPGGQMTIVCKLTDDGDCCDAVVDEEPAPGEQEEEEEEEEEETTEKP